MWFFFFRFLFLTHASDEAQIEQANLDGSSRNILVNENLLMPTLISVDEKNELVYWYDILQETIEVVSMDGKNRKTLYRTSDFGIVDSITVQEYRLYFSTRGSLFSCDMTKNISMCSKELDGSVDVVRIYGSISQSFCKWFEIFNFLCYQHCTTGLSFSILSVISHNFPW